MCFVLTQAETLALTSLKLYVFLISLILSCRIVGIPGVNQCPIRRLTWWCPEDVCKGRAETLTAAKWYSIQTLRSSHKLICEMSNLNLLESIFLYQHNTCNGIPVIRNNTPYRQMGCPVCNEPFCVFQLIVLAHAITVSCHCFLSALFKAAMACLLSAQNRTGPKSFAAFSS